MSYNKDIYFAADTAENCIKYLEDKSQSWYKTIYQNRYLDKILTSWSYYYGNFYTENHQITFGGESGELVNLPVNHYRNIAQHILNMITGSRPAFQCQSVNNDRKSMIQAELGNNIVSYYMKEKRLEKKYRKAAEYAVVMGTGYILQEWNSTKGGISHEIPIDVNKVVGFDEQDRPIDAEGNLVLPTPVYRGDIEAKTINPLDVFYDQSISDPDLNDWYLVRTFVNKFDLIAKYPEHKEDILRLSATEKSNRRITVTPYDVEIHVPVYQLFHRATESVTKGRYLYYLTDKIVLDDIDLPYPDLPIQRISPNDVLGTGLGYTSMFDLIPLQTAINSVYSTVLTNHHAFGVQNILNPMNNNVTYQSVNGGLNWIEYDHEVGKPEALQLTKSSQESYSLMNVIEKTMETISGINSVARGNPEASLKSGTALALVQAQALQFMNGFQQTYIQLLEDCGTFLINLLKEFATDNRVIAIAGITNIAKMKEFNNNDISTINRVSVQVGNALLQSNAGRWQVAENLIQMGIITTPEKVLELLNTGNLSVLTKGVTDELDVVRAENEALLKGEPVIALAIDNHAIHIREHRDVLSDPVLRFDQDLVQRTLNHIMEHINLLRGTDPDLLAINGQQPLSPQGGSPISPQQPQTQSGDLGQMMDQTPQDVPNMPQPATPPAGQFEDLPQNPQQLASQNLG